MSLFTADAPTGLHCNPEYLKVQQSISSLAKLLAVTGYFNIKLNKVTILKLSDGYELWSQTMLVIIMGMGCLTIVVMGIDLSLLASA
jgi:hypothetical protein